MARGLLFPSRILLQVQHFLLELHGAQDAARLRATITNGLAQLIPCERASFNEMDLAADSRKITPSPVPSWWSRLGDVYQAHCLDHPLWSRAHPPGMNRCISFHDPRHATTWHKSELYHEYFIELGMRHQLSAMIFRRGTAAIGLAVNRSKRDFAPQERALMDLLCPHIAQAWATMLDLTTLRCRLLDVETGGARRGGSAVLNVGCDVVETCDVPPSVAGMLQAHFPDEPRDRAGLPETLRAWLRAYQQSRDSTEALENLPAPLVVQHGSRRLSIRVGRCDAGQTTLLLHETDTVPRMTLRRRVHTGLLTAREGEVLDWMAEGKRNSEIAIILGLSPRTVEKHVEHILEKLGVETRSAAIRQMLTGHKPDA